MAPSRTYRLSPLAEVDMEDVWTYSAGQWSTVQAEVYTRDLLVAFSDLAAGRRIGAPITTRHGYLRLLVGSHAIFYRMTDTNVDIIRVLHQSMDVRRQL